MYVCCRFTEYKQQIEKDVMRTFPENPLFRESPAVAMPDDNVAYGLLLRYGISLLNRTEMHLFKGKVKGYTHDIRMT